MTSMDECYVMSRSFLFVFVDAGLLEIERDTLDCAISLTFN